VSGRRALLLVVAVVTGTAMVAACSPAGRGGTASPTAAGSPAATAASRSIVALGDSVPSGSNCDCTPYPQLTGTDLEAGSNAPITVANDAVAGYRTDDVLRQLTSDQDVIARVTRADAVEIEVGANDLGYTDACGTTLTCYTPDLPQMEKNLRAIVARVRELTAEHPVLVVLLDYWSVWLGGAYAAQKGDAYVATAQELTDDVNTAITSVATDASAAYVDLRAAFKGPDYAYDETHYLSDDGDHPNAAGHQQIATAAVHVIETTVRP
jgi:lysophospholipase L1-like esterase